jgi:hypothetical protein
MVFGSRKLMVESRGEKWCELDEALSEVAEVGGIWLRSNQLIDHGAEIVERGDRSHGWCVVGSPRSPGGGEQESGLDDLEGNLAVVESGGEAAVCAPGEAGGAGSASVEVDDAFYILGSW